MGARSWPMIAVAALLACSSTKTDAQPAPDAGNDAQPMPPVAICPETHTASGPACVPKLDACAPHEVAKLGGGCVAVGVPEGGCAPGFVHDGQGCSAILPSAACPPGKMAVPGETACAEVAECGSGTWGGITDATVWVDAAYVGSSDGSAAKPWRTVGAAIGSAPAGAKIAVAAGSYVEDVLIDKAITLVGRCPSMVQLTGVSAAADAGALVVKGGATVRSLSIGGPATALVVDGSAGAVLEDLWVHDAPYSGVWIKSGSMATLRHLLVERVGEFGITVSGSSATIERVLVRDVSDTPFGIGIRVSPSPGTFAKASATIRTSVIERTGESGVSVLSAKASLDGVVVRDGVGLTTGDLGVGVMAFYNVPSKIVAELEVHRSVIERSRYGGIVVADATARIDRTTVRDTARKKSDGTYGRGVLVQSVSTELASLVLEDSLVERNYETGIDLDGAAKLSIVRTIVRGTKANGAQGTGIYGQLVGPKAPAIEMDACAVSDNARAGLVTKGSAKIRGSHFSKNVRFSIAGYGATLGVSASVLEGTLPTAEGLDGHGLFAASDSSRALPSVVSIADVFVRGAHKAGLANIDGTLIVERSSIREVEPEAASGLGGMGIAVQRGVLDLEPKLTLDGVLVEKTKGAGIALLGASGVVRATHVRDIGVLGGRDYGDGLSAVAVLLGDRGLRPSIVEIRGSLFENAGRAGITSFGSTVTLAGSFLLCNSFDLDLEKHFDNPFQIHDEGGNVCGCLGAFRACTAETRDLAPLGTLDEPKGP